MADFKPILDQTFSFEGGYDATANDSGNWNSRHELVGTNFGISAPLYESYLKRPPSVADMKALTKEKAKEIYKKTFWDKLPGDAIKSQSVAHIIFDGFVNSGNTMFKIVRPAINRVAGREAVAFNSKSFSPADVAVINSLPADELFSEIKVARKKYYNDLVSSNPDKYGIYKKGWNNRIDAFYFNDVVTAVALAPVNAVLVPARMLQRMWRNKKQRPIIIVGAAAITLTTGLLIKYAVNQSASRVRA